MKPRILLLVVGIGCFVHTTYGQTGPEMLRRYQAATRNLHIVGYEVQRVDSVNGNLYWNHSGYGILQRSSASNLLKAKFLVSQTDLAQTYFHNGQVGYSVDDKAKTYESNATPYAPGILGSPAGQMLVEELLAIDSTYQAVTYQLSSQGPVLTLHYPDQPDLDVRNRYTYLVLNPTTDLPRGVKTVVQRGDTRWTTIKTLTNVRVNQPTDANLLKHPTFLATYTRAVPPAPAVKSERVGQVAPGFQLPSFTQAPVALSSYRGKVVLLDFWATWCRPCIASMPELQHLQDQYKGQGLTVIGVLLDKPGSTDRARGIMQRQKALYTSLVGDQAVEKAYQIQDYPHYVLIGKNGKIAFEASGANEQLEAEIKAALGSKAP